MAGLLGDFTSWWDNRKRVGAQNVQGLLSDPAATLAMLGQQTGEDMTQYAADQAWNAGALRSVMPEVRDAAANQMAGGLLGMTAYHGSPHLFDKFDMSKIGTGEGAQAYGHGLYFAEKPGVAKSYADALSAQKKYTVEVSGTMKDVRDTTGAENIALGSLLQSPGKPIDAVIADYRREQNAPYAKLWREAADYLEANKEKIKVLPEPIVGKGNLYKVDIPDEAVGKMLDWDKPLSQQPESVRKALEQTAAKELAGQQKLLGGEWTGRDAYEFIKDRSRRQNGATDALHALGIPGIRYLDAGSRGKGGTSNFVLFDDSLAKILSRE